ncbi:MAG: hypothetical protein JJU36_04160 [Phycisphaeraceae bacterium]|nr:hypothetical protein [Phycisphaeraceae bacterium]
MPHLASHHHHRRPTAPAIHRTHGRALGLTLAVASCFLLLGFKLGPSARADQPAPPPAVVVVDGQRIDINGQIEIPRGLFGVHSARHDPETAREWGIDCFRGIFFGPGSNSRVLDGEGNIRDTYRDMPVVIDCQGDRYQVATLLTDPNFRQFYDRIGREYAQRTLAHPERTFYAEFWNEPYLNWASRSHGSARNHYHPRFYDETKAKDGGPVTIKGWDEPLEHLRWRKHWAKGEDGRIYYGVAIPDGLKPGDTFRGRSPADWYFTNRQEQTFTVVEQWGIEDPTQVSFWSGKQNYQFYMWMFKPWAKAIRQVNPDVQIIAGWDFGYHHGDWAVWRQLLQPMLDEAIDYIDGICEHHYGINPRMVTVWYEMATAYTVSRHDKWIRSFNTECGPGQDPAVHGVQALEEREPDAVRAAAGRASYMLRDVLELAYHSPAKVGSRTTHQPREQGEGQAFRLLRELRGPMVRTISDDPDIWAVSGINNDRLVVMAINNSSQERAVNFHVAAPDRATFKPGTIATIGAAREGGERRLAVLESPQDAGGRQVELSTTLARHQAVRYVLPLENARPVRDGQPQIQRRQFFAKEGVLNDVANDKPLTLTIPVPETGRSRADRAWLQIAFERVVDREVRLTLNGQEIELPAGRNFTLRLPIDPERIEAQNTLRFTRDPSGARGDRDAYRIVMASILTDRATR